MGRRRMSGRQVDDHDTSAGGTDVGASAMKVADQDHPVDIETETA